MVTISPLVGPCSGAHYEKVVAALMLAMPRLGNTAYWRWRQLHPSGLPITSRPLEEHLAVLPTECHSSFTRLYQCGDSLQDPFESLPVGCQVIGFNDDNYPSLLRLISDPPPLLYVVGDSSALSKPQLAVVGSRGASRYGLDLAHRFSKYLAQQGMAITSGLALGVDAYAHRGALAGEGITVAVLGTGIDVVYPAVHRQLSQEIVESGGVLVSEFAPGAKPHRSHFPRRNRIISGLSAGVLVVEAALKSGSLITARRALDQNREVFAIPGSIHNPTARGCHQLIREGATLVETAEDIAEQMQHLIPASQTPTLSDAANCWLPLQEEEDIRLWHALTHEPQTADQIERVCQLKADVILAKLTLWELEGRIWREHDRFYRAAL